MKWFRLHSEARNDAKLRSLSPAQKWVWFSLLCYASEQEERGCIHSTDRDLLAVECADGDGELLEATLDKLKRLKIVALEGDKVCFVNFMKRQYDKPSDSPERVSERVSRHRARAETPQTKAETLTDNKETPSNTDETPKERLYSDTDSDTENTNTSDAAAVLPETKPSTDTQPKPPLAARVRFEEFYTAYPKKRNRGEAEKIWARRKPTDEDLEAMLAALVWQKQSADWLKDGGQYIPYPASYLSAAGWRDEPPAASSPSGPPPAPPPKRPYRIEDDTDFQQRFGPAAQGTNVQGANQ